MPVMRAATTPDIALNSPGYKAADAEVYSFCANLAVRAFTPELIDEVLILAMDKPELQLASRIDVLADQVYRHVQLALKELSPPQPLPSAGRRGLSLRTSSSRSARQAALRAPTAPVRRSNTAAPTLCPRGWRPAPGQTQEQLCSPPPMEPPTWDSPSQINLKGRAFEPVTQEFASAPPARPRHNVLPRVDGDLEHALSDGPAFKRRSQGFSLNFSSFAGLRPRRNKREKSRIGRAKHMQMQEELEC